MGGWWVWIGWAGLGWAGLGWAGLGWAGLLKATKPNTPTEVNSQDPHKLTHPKIYSSITASYKSNNTRNLTNKKGRTTKAHPYNIPCAVINCVFSLALDVDSCVAQLGNISILPAFAPCSQRPVLTEKSAIYARARYNTCSYNYLFTKKTASPELELIPPGNFKPHLAHTNPFYWSRLTCPLNFNSWPPMTGKANFVLLVPIPSKTTGKMVSQYRWR